MYTSHAQPFSYHTAPATLWPNFLLGQTHAPLRVILIDDDAHAVSSIKQELNHDERINLVATAVNARQAKKLIANSEFDVMLIDTHLSSGNGCGDGLALISLMKQSQPSAEAVVISKQEDQELAIQAFALGAAGFLVKNAWFGSFSQAVLQVANGGAFISPKVARQLLARLTASHHHVPAAQNMHILAHEDNEAAVGIVNKKLSQRELEILQFVAVGDSSAHISTKTSISVQTVSTHIKNAYRKLNVHTRLQAVASAKSLGLIL